LAAPAPADLKAAFLCRFMEYITWPESDTTTNGLTIGVFDYPAFRDALSEEPPPALVNGRPVTFVPAPTPESGRTCTVVYLNTAERAPVEDYLAGLAGAPVLTVSDVRGGSRVGVAITFILVQDKVRFVINREAAEAVGLDISARLLRLGRVVGSSTNMEEGVAP
jgi:hypothetical protein